MVSIFLLHCEFDDIIDWIDWAYDICTCTHTFLTWQPIEWRKTFNHCVQCNWWQVIGTHFVFIVENDCQSLMTTCYTVKHRWCQNELLGWFPKASQTHVNLIFFYLADPTHRTFQYWKNILNPAEVLLYLQGKKT